MAMHYLAHVGALRRAPDVQFRCLLFLADWESCLLQGEQITDLEWSFSPSPTADDIPYFPQLSIRNKVDQMLGRKPADLNLQDCEALDRVIRRTSGMRLSDIIRLTYSTYPGMTCDRGKPLDLPVYAATRHKDPYLYGPDRLPDSMRA